MNISAKLLQNHTQIKKLLPSQDIAYTPLKVGTAEGLLIFAKDLVNKDSIGDLIIRPAEKYTNTPSKNTIDKVFFSPEKLRVYTLLEASQEVVNGNAILFIDGINFGLSFEVKDYKDRTIAEPPTSTVIKGPREGFVENITINIGLIRKRVKSASLIFEQMTVGKYSKTPVAICYIDEIANKGLVKQLKNKIKKINIDAVLDSSYITKCILEHKHSLFKQVGNTEKPDILVAKIMEGRIAILVDGSPLVLTVPYLLIEDFQSPSDYYVSPYTATTARIIRLASVILSLLLPSFFVASELFHLQLIPLSFLLTIINSIQGIPLSPSHEMFFTLLIFEILNEASVRMPKYVGMVVSIVGGLVLGETAVNAGIISPPALMIIALSGICLYTVPELEQTFSFLRLLLLIIAGSFGGYGLILAFGALLIYIVSFESFSTPLCAPFSPLITKDLKDSFYRSFINEHELRPLSLPNKNRTRLGKRRKND